ncbi:MAG: Gx transporter family protein, partial [Clostridia bacterium]|nr:Gx transporter family protein [Clostridia bacterium]
MSRRGGRIDSVAQRIALLAMMTALAFVLSWIERLFPPIAGAVPGIKLGLANVVVLIMLYYRGFRQAFVVSLVRVLAVGFVFANLIAMFYSLAGGLLSLCVMALARQTRWFSPVGVSVAGGVSHNVGQILLAM